MEASMLAKILTIDKRKSGATLHVFELFLSSHRFNFRYSSSSRRLEYSLFSNNKELPFSICSSNKNGNNVAAEPSTQKTH